MIVVKFNHKMLSKIGLLYEVYYLVSKFGQETSHMTVSKHIGS